MVAVCTFRRATLLERLLVALDTVSAPTDATVEILVVDNDPDASAAAVMERLQLRRPAEYVHEPSPGISAARNAALRAAAASDFVAFIDDDEVPHADWLATLVDTARTHRADVVAGPTENLFARVPPRWIDGGGFFARAVLPTGSAIPFAACGNLLLRTSILRHDQPWFDDRFGLTGGEDSEFTARLARAGARLIWCQEAIAVEDVPADRITARWVLRRSYRMGNTAGRMQLLSGASYSRTGVLLRGAGRICAGILGMLVSCVPGRPHWAAGLRMAVRGAGMIAAAAGGTFAEYARSGQGSTDS